MTGDSASNGVNTSLPRTCSPRSKNLPSKPEFSSRIANVANNLLSEMLKAMAIDSIDLFEDQSKLESLRVRFVSILTSLVKDVADALKTDICGHLSTYFNNGDTPDVSSNTSDTVIQNVCTARGQQILPHEEMAVINPLDGLGNPSSSIASYVNLSEVKDETDFHCGDAPVSNSTVFTIIQNGCIDKEQVILPNQEMVFVDPRDDLGTPSGSTEAYVNPSKVKEESNIPCGDKTDNSNNTAGTSDRNEIIIKDEVIVSDHETNFWDDPDTSSGSKTSYVNLSEVKEEASNLSDKQHRKSRVKKKHFCKYCKKLRCNFSRHVFRVHQDIDEVSNCDRLGRKSFIRRLASEGDDEFNKQNPFSLIVMRASRKPQDIVRDKCPSCKALISRRHIVNHMKICLSQVELGTSAASLRELVEKERLVDHPYMCDALKNSVLPRMRNDPIKELCETDPLLFMYGNKLCERFECEGQVKNIRRSLRIVGRIVRQCIIEDSSIIEAADIFQPTKYEVFLKAMKVICGLGRWSGDEDRVPTAPYQYGLVLKELADYYLVELMTAPNNQNEKSIQDLNCWLDIYVRHYDKQVGSGN